jgi:NTE family protein
VALAILALSLGWPGAAGAQQIPQRAERELPRETLAVEERLAEVPGERGAGQDDSRCRVGVALSGGGGRGFALIGALQALEEAGIPIECIAGTSMGALIGALYAGGYSIQEIEQMAAEVDWYKVFMKPMQGPVIPPWHRLHDTQPLVDLPFDYWSLSLPQAMLPDQRINELMMRLFAEPGFLGRGDFDNLPIPYRTVATDLTGAGRVVLSSGDLSRAVRASVSFPLAFPPVAIDDYLLIDGGLVDNLPIGVVRDMGARLVIAIDIASPPVDVSITRDLFSVTYSITDVLRAQAAEVFSEEPDLLIEPDLHGHYYTDYTQWDKLAEWGYEATTEVMAEILERMADLGITMDEDDFADASPGAGSEPLEGRSISEIRVLRNENIPERRIIREFGFDIGDPFSLTKAMAGVDRLYSTGFFELVWLDYQAGDDGGVIIIIEVQEVIGTLGIGAGYNEDDSIWGFARWQLRNILGSRQQFQVEAYGGSRVSSFDLRLSANRLLATGIGYELRAGVREDKPRFFVDGEFINRASFLRQGASLGGVLPITRAGRVRFDYAAENVEIGERAGVPLSPVTNRLRRVDAAFLWSSLDDPDAPTRGLATSFDIQKSSPWLGASVEYLRAELRFQLAAPLGSRNVLHFDFLGGLSWDDLPVHEYFMMGGPVLMPGYNREEFWGRQALAASAGYSYLFSPVLQMTLRGGGGNVWQSREEIDLSSMLWGGGAGLQYLTPFGPIGGGVGVNQDGKAEFYFWVGYQ